MPDAKSATALGTHESEWREAYEFKPPIGVSVAFSAPASVNMSDSMVLTRALLCLLAVMIAIASVYGKS